jgi:hypothetical protein
VASPAKATAVTGGLTAFLVVAYLGLYALSQLRVELDRSE